jgi:chorismate mutase/prephenate dehydratase
VARRPSDTTSSEGQELAKLRARVDEIDDKIHDLLMARAQVVESVARIGKAVVFRPGREASILRRLLEHHSGHLPSQTLVSMWRELLAGTIAMQISMRIAVFDPTSDGAVTATAREHFGFHTAMEMQATAQAALAAVRTGSANVAVLPFPFEVDTWRALEEVKPQLYVNARLPFLVRSPIATPNADALAITAAPPDASGDDRSFIALDHAPDRERLTNAGLTLRGAYGTVVEVDGLLDDRDERLADFDQAAVLGGYAVPV